ncbi:MAG: hypothetical protein MUF48_09950 [Pirellulaceae bacterium]|jgi:hypothetical protein|nr:hypothetical protein [Pirellulaceae bacterium]
MPGNEQSPHFSLGRVLATPGALETIQESGQSPLDFLSRHARGDWGCISPDDRCLNDRAVSAGGRIFSAYETRTGARLWVITEAEDDAGHRACTTILLPQDY